MRQQPDITSIRAGARTRECGVLLAAIAVMSILALAVLLGGIAGAFRQTLVLLPS